MTCMLGLVASCAWALEPAEVYRFGTAGLKDRLTNQFLLRNDRAEILEVRSVTPSCDCVQVKRWTSHVEAGTTGVVEILFVPDTVGAVDYRVFVKTLTLDQPEIEYAIQGVVTGAPRLRVDREWALYLGTKEAVKAIQNPGGLIWVDVRTPETQGHLRMPDSLQIPLYAVKTKGFLRGRPVVLVDEGYGSPALEAECRKLRELGFSNLSLWYGGLNAWRRRGGQVEGGGEPGVGLVPPVALADIVCSTDWLVVSAAATETPRMDGAETIPFDVSKKDEFVAALNAVIAARPQVASVLIVTNAGEDYGAMAEAADGINAFLFFLEGGWTAWEANRRMMDAIQQSRIVTVQSTSVGTGGGAAQMRPGGCGGCPK